MKVDCAFYMGWGSDGGLSISNFWTQSWGELQPGKFVQALSRMKTVEKY